MQRMHMELDQHRDPSWSPIVRERLSLASLLKCYNLEEGRYHFRGRFYVFGSPSLWQNDVQGENEVIRRLHPDRFEVNLRDLFIELVLLSECRGPFSLFTLYCSPALSFLFIRRRLWYNFKPYHSMWMCYLSCLFRYFFFVCLTWISFFLFVSRFILLMYRLRVLRRQQGLYRDAW